jgi:hypothetical protein
MTRAAASAETNIFRVDLAGGVYLSDEFGEIAAWVADEWRDDDTVVLAMLNALKIGYERGPAVLRATIGWRTLDAPRDRLTAARNNHAAEADDEDSASDTFGDCLVCGHPVLKCAGSETRCGKGFAHDEDCLTEHATQCDECRAMEFYPSRPALLADLREIEAALSPENLSCDGLASPAAARKRKVELTRRYRAVVDQLGGVPPKEELWPELFQA